MIMKIKLEDGTIWELSTQFHFNCAIHGKCPAVLEKRFANGFESIKTIGASRLFFCKKCGNIKIMNVWNNISILAEAKVIEEV